MFVSFEGIDGSGKTTLSNLVCDRLRAAGHGVLHAREKGVLASGVARRVRELTRDARLLEMSARTELFLNLARETQQLDEIVRPALAERRLVVADRSLYSLVALAAAGRGLPRDEVEAAVRVGAGGTWPDLVVLVDVDPDLARLRKRVGKILEGRDGDAESRKGLCGAGLQVRMRRHLRAEADRDPARWVVTCNEGRPLAELADEIAETILAHLAPTARPAPPRRAPRADVSEEELSPERIAAGFRAAIGALAASEPHLAAFLLAGIPGAPEHALRVALAPRAPRLVARSLHGLVDPARSRCGVRSRPRLRPTSSTASATTRRPRRWRCARRCSTSPRRRRSPGSRGTARPSRGSCARAVSIAGTSARSWSASAGVDDPDAWALRAEGMRRELFDAVGRSLAGIAGARADALRVALADEDRLAALRATAGVDGEVARELRERLFDHAAKRVLRSLTGSTRRTPGRCASARSPPRRRRSTPSTGWTTRGRGRSARRASSSGRRRRCPRSAQLAASERGRALVARALRVAPGSLPVLRNAHAAFARATLVAGAAAPTRLEESTCSI